MNLINSIQLLTLILIFLTIIPITAAQEKDVKLIPYPQKVEWLDGNFLLSGTTSINCSSGKLKDYFVSRIVVETGLNIDLKSKNSTGCKIILIIDSLGSNANKEAYELTVTTDTIKITAASEEGLFRGIQTLFQLIPADDKVKKNNSNIRISCCKIIDSPAFTWRGLNLDCARHFMTKDFIKRYIDILAYYKFNILHWHLTDDQGWRIEIKKYPQLTKVGAWRKEADGSIYGGYYSQEDIREIVSYAQSRYITIVPEIEMPGHCIASLASYPGNSCKGGPFEVATTWGVFNDVYCAGNDSTFTFLENILDEVTAMFPGNYIHIGGDEVPKDRWKECPKCQARIKSEGLKDENELQSYFIKRISNYLYSKGKQVIGWDEILEGGLAPGSIVQSWQGFQGAVEAAKLGHYTICSPTSNTYLDYEPEDLNLQTAYSFNPLPAELPADEKKFILGSEVNLWTERAPQQLVDQKLFPRILALAEVFWSNPQNRDYNEFLTRVRKVYDDLRARGIQYGPESKAITYSTSYNEEKKEFTINVTSGQSDLEIRYTEDGNTPDSISTLYNSPIIIDKSVNLNIAAFRNSHLIGKKYNLSFDFHKALNASLTLTNKYDEKYSAGGKNALIDGIRATDDLHDGLWQGYEGVDFEGIIDLGAEKEISKVTPRFLMNTSSWIFLPDTVEVSLSNDNINYSQPKTILNNIPQKNPDIILKDFQTVYNNQKARYIKVKAVSIKICPPWHPGAGHKAWLFIDEIEVQ
jgi:hexosaminidase